MRYTMRPSYFPKPKRQSPTHPTHLFPLNAYREKKRIGENKLVAARALDAHAKPPTVYGFLYRVPRGFTVTIDCPHCGREHIHGWPRSDLAPSHRHAHCDADVNRVGYFIALFPCDSKRLSSLSAKIRAGGIAG